MSDSMDRTSRATALGKVSPPFQDPMDQTTFLRREGASAHPSKREEDKAADFENFLNQTSTTTVQKPHKDQQSDAADLVTRNSVYLPPTTFPS